MPTGNGPRRWRHTTPDRLVANGGSAGGLLMGVVVNMRPDLFKAIVADVPFVDVINTMLDASLPLKAQEWEQWGNPQNPEHYRYMKSYSPNDNTAATSYAAVFVSAGLSDPRVVFHEPAKWVAKLRSVATGAAPIVLRTELGAGHAGPSGRYERWRDEAGVNAFVLSVLGEGRAP